MPSRPDWVFTCFKRIERCGDTVTGAAGPVFVAVATVLFVLGTLCFLDVILPTLPWPWLSVLPCFLIIINLFGHYYFACTVSPGFAGDPPQRVGRSFIWARRRRHSIFRANGVHWSSHLNITPASTTKCPKCGETKPERTHHCRVCNRCVLKYDHHCPVRINQCVGLHNERHFVMFMSVFTTQPSDTWEHRISPILFTIIYFVCLVMCLAVGTMLAWQLWSVAVAETAVESYDHEHYRKVATSRGETFQNSYDLGWIVRILLILFMSRLIVGSPIYTLILPLRVPPYTDGRSWAAGMDSNDIKGFA
ncbi:DHHC palmitoyltransferase-domain-containing protein [Russula vinacea]|nr:DHHC palmitoyltransferase-domain-containing protein [Russula vinacea]